LYTSICLAIVLQFSLQQKQTKNLETSLGSRQSEKKDAVKL
jgi:hypothetical protein